MTEIRVRPEWFTEIGLAAKCGTPDDVMALCLAIQRASLGEEVGELPPLAELLFNPIAEDINEMKTKQNEISQKRKDAANNRWESRDANECKSMQNECKTDAKKCKNMQMHAKEKEEIKREEKEEVSPHTPLQEEREERNREEREIYMACSLRSQACAEPENPAPAPPPEPVPEPVITIPLNDGSEYPVLPDFVAELSSLYPAVEPLQELRNIRGWCLGNPTKRKTKRGVKRFITTWFAKEQDRPRSARASPQRPHKLTLEEVMSLPEVAMPWASLGKEDD